MVLCVLGYNFTRVMDIVGVKVLKGGDHGVGATRPKALMGPIWQPRG